MQLLLRNALWCAVNVGDGPSSGSAKYTILERVLTTSLFAVSVARAVASCLKRSSALTTALSNVGCEEMGAVWCSERKEKAREAVRTKEP